MNTTTKDEKNLLAKDREAAVDSLIDALPIGAERRLRLRVAILSLVAEVKQELARKMIEAVDADFPRGSQAIGTRGGVMAAMKSVCEQEGITLE